MAKNLDIPALLNTIGGYKPGAPLDKFIGEAIFPSFKNLEPGTRIVFDFPLTALVGANGSGKSSILHALWGMPRGSSTARFWFSTAVDPISDGGDNGLPRYIYKHWVRELNGYVETKKVRGARRADYWEPARALKSDGMNPMPTMIDRDRPFRSSSRWNPTVRDVRYINFKCEFSAFDRFFYFPDRSQTHQQRLSEILKGAKRLARVIDGDRQTYSTGGHPAVFENRELDPEELGWVSYILGREYQSARYVLHRLYGLVEAPTVVFQRANLTYSEAFAGSGELAVVRAVIELCATPNLSLVLLDEPETSLHPGAQERLLGFLLEMIRTKHLQIVLSTHSPTLVNLLPKKAVKVLEENQLGQARVVDASHPQVAFNRLGYVAHGKLTLAVEDELLRSLVEMAMRMLDPGEQQAIELYVPPAGADNILTSVVPTWLSDKRDAYVIIDGDQDPKVPLPDPDNMTPAERKKLGGRIYELFKVKPLHVKDGHEEPASSYVKWLSRRVRYLSAVCPEQVLLEALVGEEKAAPSADNNKLAKEALISALMTDGHPTTADALKVATTFIIKNGGVKNKHILHLKGILQEFLADHSNQQ
ncbi:ATP-binding protein [Lacisediminimonas profundi]|uniref:ATP-binding protein n=1 Tax=Lacisediminimonas profundi TaxID=2603856 RepID=UPI00124B3827|nr:ATP-binding protein [Lacisediminimonas profundi]